MIDTDEKLTLLNVINHWKFKEVEAEVKRLREGISALVDKMTTTVHFYKIADETAQSYASSLKELIE